MNKNNSLIEKLPDTDHEFQLDLIGRITKKRFLGDFKCKIPTIKDQGLIARHNAMLNGEFPIYLDAGIQKMHKMIAYLRYTLTDYPTFWRDADFGYDLRDDNVIEAIYDEVIAFENDWLEQIWGKQDDEKTEG